MILNMRDVGRRGDGSITSHNPKVKKLATEPKNAFTDNAGPECS